MKKILLIVPLVLFLFGCSPQPQLSDGVENIPKENYIDLSAADYINIDDEAVALSGSAPSMPIDLTVKTGSLQVSNDKAVIDYSNGFDGYIMVQFTGDTDKRIKVLIKGPTTQYQYNINPKEWVSLPLSDGNGKYEVGVYENVKDTSYSNVLSENIDVTMTDEFAPFLRSNQYVNIEAAPNAIQLASQLCAGTDTLGKVGKVYDYVVNNLTYDDAKAANVQSGYLPNLDSVLASKKGICFDYAALMTGMLRSQGVPCKLVVGYAGTAYHAWINVWTEKDGWIEGTIYFDGNTWQRMDPTFASSGGNSDSIKKYIGDGNNYSAKYFY